MEKRGIITSQRQIDETNEVMQLTVLRPLKARSLLARDLPLPKHLRLRRLENCST